MIAEPMDMMGRINYCSKNLRITGTAIIPHIAVSEAIDNLGIAQEILPSAYDN